MSFYQLRGTDLIFDETSYSPLWAAAFPLRPVHAAAPADATADIQTHSILGAVTGREGNWRFEPGLGVDFELRHALLLHTGFKLGFENGRHFELLQVQPGLLLGRIPARATPELFAADQHTAHEDGFSFLTDGDTQIALWLRQQEGLTRIALCVRQGTREDCKKTITAATGAMEERLDDLWAAELAARERMCAKLPDPITGEYPGLAAERVLGLIEPPRGIFKGSWIRNPESEKPECSLRIFCNLLPAVALVQPERVPELLKTLSSLPKLASGAWAERYSAEGPVSEAPALPIPATRIAAMKKQLPERTELPDMTEACRAHLQSFLTGKCADGLPQWPEAETAFTPEVTDPDSLIQFDLAALLVLEIESLQFLSGDSTLLEGDRTKLASGTLDGFWQDKRKRLLDKTTDGERASRVTAGGLIPLLWRNPGRSQAAAMRQSLQNPDELRSPEGIRQWQPKKEDPIPPPVHSSTQHVFISLLEKLPGEAAALLSADWHRRFEEDPEFRTPETAALYIRLLPYASRINPHLERYPGWVRKLEKHRKNLVTAAAVVLFLIPASFGIYFTVRSDYNLADESLQAGEAETLVTMGNLEEAENVYTRLLTRARNDSRKNSYYLNRADLRFRQEKYEQALEDYLLAIELDPIGNLYKARWNLGQTYARLDRKDEAIETLRAFVAEYGEELPTYRQMAEHAIRLWQK